MAILLAAVTFGLAGGYAWSALTATKVRPEAPKPVEVKAVSPLDLPDSASDREWAARAADENSTAFDGTRADPTAVERSVHYTGCDEVRAAGKAPLHAGEPGYRSQMDSDGDGIACEPIRR
ncbi:MAG TPA: excalibur calcium-binding domain-containing protein [Sphingomicrobium sp.]